MVGSAPFRTAKFTWVTENGKQARARARARNVLILGCARFPSSCPPQRRVRTQTPKPRVSLSPALYLSKITQERRIVASVGNFSVVWNFFKFKRATAPSTGVKVSGGETGRGRRGETRESAASCVVTGCALRALQANAHRPRPLRLPPRLWGLLSYPAASATPSSFLGFAPGFPRVLHRGDGRAGGGLGLCPRQLARRARVGEQAGARHARRRQDARVCCVLGGCHSAACV